MTITIYTDGSARFNPGPGGWGARLEWNGHIKEISGSFRHTTNNRMELTAVIEAIKCLKVKNVTLDIYSDSSYVVNSISKKWVNNWVKTNFKDKKNKDLWLEFLEISKDYTINMIWVKGHAANPGNNRCDELATAASADLNKQNWLVDKIYEDANV
jgi:ribonuclease HI